MLGGPIRNPADQWLHAPTHGISPLVASFFGMSTESSTNNRTANCSPNHITSAALPAAKELSKPHSYLHPLQSIHTLLPRNCVTGVRLQSICIDGPPPGMTPILRSGPDESCHRAHICAALGSLSRGLWTCVNTRTV